MAQPKVIRKALISHVEVVKHTHHRWEEVKSYRGLPPGTAICTERYEDGKLVSASHDCYRPPRRKDESPVEYYRRTKCVDDNFDRRHKGRYYCNPAHCSRSWTRKAARDEHLDAAYAILA